MLVGDEPGDSFSYTFTGQAVGLVAVVGKDAGIIEYRIDDGEWHTRDLKHRYGGIHLPWLHVLADELDAKQQHTLTVRLTDQRANSACRLVYLAVNGE